MILLLHVLRSALGSRLLNFWLSVATDSYPGMAASKKLSFPVAFMGK